MRIFKDGEIKEASLTTNHAASSYGQPVLVIDGEAFGPGDVILIGDPESGKEEGAVLEATDEERAAAREAGFME